MISPDVLHNFRLASTVRGQSHPILATLLAAVFAIGLLVVPLIHSASSQDIPIFDPAQYTAEQLATSTQNDGIPDVWKTWYGLSITDPAVSNADYTASGIMNREKYQLNIYPLAQPDQPEPVAKPKAAAKKPALAKAAAAAPSPPSLSNSNFLDGVTIGDATTSGGFGGSVFHWKYNTGVKAWQAQVGSQIEVWRDAKGKQFVELNASPSSRGIEQKIANAVAGTYVLSWRDLCRNQGLNNDGAYRVKVLTKPEKSKKSEGGTPVPTTPKTTDDIYKPLKPTSYIDVDKWAQQYLVLTLTREQMGAKQDVWIVFEPVNLTSTYGALIAEVNLAPIEVMPDVLPVNSGFGEGRVDAQTGFAIPDCDDPAHSLKAALDHLDKKWKAGDFVTEKLHHGFFGLKPGSLPYSITAGATVKVRKLDKDDLDTQRKESGHVRLYAISGPEGSKQEKVIELYDPVTLQPNDIGNLYQNPHDTVEYYIEGVKPGKITLEFSFQKGDMTFKHEQEFLVASQQTAKKWLDEIRYQIRLQTGNNVELNDYLPATGWKPNKSFVWHTSEVAAIYNYYGQLFQEHPDEMDWMGAAKMVGGAVWAGLSDAQSQTLPGGPTKELMGGQILIYKDLAWQHRAYVASGIWSLNWVSKTNNAPANGVSGDGALDLPTWKAIDNAIQDKDYGQTKDGTKRLVTREQAQIIVPMWDDLEAHRSGVVSIMSGAAKNPVDPNSPLFEAVINELDPKHKRLSGRLSQYESRRAFAFESLKHSVFPIWWGDASTANNQTLDKNARITLTKIAIEKWAVPFSIYGSVYKP